MASWCRLCLAFLLAAPAMASPGSLLIVGGALGADNAAIHKAFLDRRPSGRPMVAIIPSASSFPTESAQKFAADLVRHGADPRDIHVVKLASEDDPTTDHLDESRWAANAESAAEIARINRAGAIWFTGGDQLRTTRLLIRQDGSDTAMLAAIRARLAEGAVIGGTSAGAAIMSRVMITSGEPMVALTRPVERQQWPDNRSENGPLVLGDGLGFLPQGLVDQHFDARARLGRLARALFTLPPDARIGFGIDENMALAVDLGTNSAQAIGPAHISMIDARTATAAVGQPWSASGMRLSILSDGDRITLHTLSLLPSAGAKPSQANRATGAQPLADSAGIAVAPRPVASILMDGLFDGAPTTAIERLSFIGQDAVIFRFSRDEHSTASVAVRSGGRAAPTIAQLLFSIRPVRLSIEDVATKEAVKEIAR